MMKNLSQWILFFSIAACAKNQASNSPVEPSSSPGKTATKSDSSSGNDSAGNSADVGEKVKLGPIVVNSLSNEPLTSRRINKSAAAAIANQEAQSPSDLQISIFAGRLAGSSVQSIFNKAKSLVAAELKKGVDRDIPDTIKLELAMAAIHEKKIGFARLYLNQLASSANPKVKAGALNAQGVLALIANDYSSAQSYFKNSLKASENYPSALFNAGFLALRFGDFENAIALLQKLGDDWYAKMGVLVASRNLADDSKAETLCNNLLSSKSNHKMILYNCGLFYGQNKGDKAKGKDLVTKALKIQGGSDRWDSAGYKVLENFGG